jgi:hypothetical protein
VGGQFTTAGGVVANGIAKWNGSSWSALGSGMNGEVRALAVSGSGLYAGGLFTTAGGKVSAYVAEALFVASPVLSRSPASQTAEVGSTVSFSARAAGVPPLTYEWFFNGTDPVGVGTNRFLRLLNVQPSQAGAYTVIVTNIAGAATSAPAMLSVIPPVERRPVPALKLTGQPGDVRSLDYCDSLGSGEAWKTMATMTLSATQQYYFDISAPLPPQRFYRVWQAAAPGGPPGLGLPFMVPAITLSGSPGNSIRVDGINQIGPTGAWFTLDIVTLTNAAQLYFDLAAPGQPQRLYRLVPVP